MAEAEIGNLVVKMSMDTAALSRQLKIVQNEFKEAGYKLGDFGKTTEGLKLRADSLTKQLDLQRQRVLALENAVKRSSEVKGADAKATQLLEVNLSKAKAQMAATEAELKRVTAELEKQSSGWYKVSKVCEETGNKLKAVGEKMSAVGKKMSMYITAPIVAAGGAAFKFAADLEDAIGATDQIFKDQSQAMQQWADSLESYYGIAKTEALTYANTMGAMLQNIGGLTEEEAAKQAQTLIKLAGDLAAMFGGAPADAVQALTGALKGNNAMLDNYGMGVNEATIKTKALEMGLIKEGEQLDLAGKQAATLALIMEQTADAQGQAAREAEGASGTMRALTTELKNIATELGQVLIPLITPLIAKIRDLAKQFGEMSPQMQRTIVAVAGLVAVVGPLLAVLVPIVTTVSGLITGLAGLSGALAGGASLVSALAAGFPALGAAITLLTGPIGLVVAAIGALVAAGVLIYKNWDKIKETLDRVWGAIVNFFKVTIPEAINTGLKWFSELPDKVAKFMNELPGKIGYALGFALGKIVQFGIDAIKWAATEVPKFIASVIQFYAELPGKIWEWLKAALAKVAEWGKNLVSWAKSTLPGVITTIVSFFQELPGRLLDIGINMIKSLWEGITSMASWLWDNISGFLSGIVSGIKAALDISSPSRVFMDIGKNMALGLVEGLKGQKAAVEAALASLIPPRLAVNLDAVGGAAGLSHRAAMLSPGALRPAVANSYSTSYATTYNQGGNTIVFNVTGGWEQIERELTKRGVRF